MITRNGVQSLLNRNPHLGPAIYVLNVRTDPVRRLSYQLSVISQHKTPDPPTDLVASRKEGKGRRGHVERHLWTTHVDLRCQGIWLSIRAHIWSSPGDFRRLPSLASPCRIYCSEIGILVVGGKARRCNEAVVLDAPRRVSGSCVGNSCLANTIPAHPLRICSSPRVGGNDAVDSSDPPSSHRDIK